MTTNIDPITPYQGIETWAPYGLAFPGATVSIVPFIPSDDVVTPLLSASLAALDDQVEASMSDALLSGSIQRGSPSEAGLRATLQMDVGAKKAALVAETKRGLIAETATLWRAGLEAFFRNAQLILDYKRGEIDRANALNSQDEVKARLRIAWWQYAIHQWEVTERLKLERAIQDATLALNEGQLNVSAQQSYFDYLINSYRIEAATDKTPSSGVASASTVDVTVDLPTLDNAPITTFDIGL